MVLRAKRTVNKLRNALAAVSLLANIMPNMNCCMPLCHATSKRNKQLSWHALPSDPKLKKRLAVAIRNDTLKVNSRGTSEGGLHFQGG